uniref:Glutamate carboxypeptidase 2 n=1 Tax=Globodera rostochiensis TaxID=31243 RepID=A0A914HXR2_GLORO
MSGMGSVCATVLVTSVFLFQLGLFCSCSVPVLFLFLFLLRTVNSVLFLFCSCSCSVPEEQEQVQNCWNRKTLLVTTVLLFLLPNNFYEIDQQSDLTTVPEDTVIQLDLYDSEEWRTVAGSIECDIGKLTMFDRQSLEPTPTGYNRPGSTKPRPSVRVRGSTPEPKFHHSPHTGEEEGMESNEEEEVVHVRIGEQTVRGRRTGGEERRRLTALFLLCYAFSARKFVMDAFTLKSGSDSAVRFRLSRNQACFVAFVCLCLILTTALLIAILVFQILAQYGAKKVAFGTEEIRSSIFANIDPGRIAANLEAFTEKPHPAGTEANKKVADRIMETWKANGLEDVHQIPYDVLLSYPKWDTPNHVYVLASNDRVLFKTDGLSPDLTGNDSTPEASIQWLAYSPEGTVQGQPVYCHHGRVQDFDRLEKEFGIANLNGKIAIMRYGENYRGDMVHHAYERGASGVIIYSDPAEIARDGPDQVYPRTDWMPPSGVQRGSLLRADGDPLTPLLPARKDFHTERTIENAQLDPETMPPIPTIPLSYGDAYHILSRMDGPEVPSEWRGGLNITYRVGPGFKSGKGQTVRVEVHSRLEVRTIQNVVGYIWGSERPDEWVMLGNHYDAWVFGAIDPNSGSAILAEVGTGLAQTVRTTGWRPKRTVVFCAWDAEEPGLIGSTEFVEEFADVLKERAIVYMNVDNIPSNVSLYVRAVPSLYQAAVDASKSVKDPITGKGSVFDSWIGHFPSKTDWLPGVPNMGIPGGGSDQKSFLDFLGIPAMMIAYIDPSRGQYPLYHTRYELPFVNEQIFDNNHLAVHKAVGEYWAELARLFADSPLLPISATTFAHRFLADYLEGIKKPILSINSQFPNDTEPAKSQLDNLIKNAHQFMAQAEAFEREQSANANLEWANVRLRKLDQCFVNPSMGIAREEPTKRHVLFATSKDNSYAATTMSIVYKRIGQLREAKSGAERVKRANELALELTVVQQAIRCAINTLAKGI